MSRRLQLVCSFHSVCQWEFISTGRSPLWSSRPWLSSFRASGVDAATEFYGRSTFSSFMQFSGLIKPRQRRCYSSLCYVWENEGEGKERGRCYSSLCYVWENEGEGKGRGRCYSSLCYIWEKDGEGKGRGRCFAASVIYGRR